MGQNATEVEGGVDWIGDGGSNQNSEGQEWWEGRGKDEEGCLFADLSIAVIEG